MAVDGSTPAHVGSDAAGRPQVSKNRWKEIAAAGGRIAGVAKFTHRQTGKDIAIDLCFSRPDNVRERDKSLAKIKMSPSVVECKLWHGVPGVEVGRLLATFTFVIPYLKQAELNGGFEISLGDVGLERTLSFSASTPDFLVPDPDFIRARAYVNERRLFETAPPWEQRADMLYWRGTDTGVNRYFNIEDAPRVVICRLGRQHPHLVNAAITAIQGKVAARHDHYRRNSYLGPREDQLEILKYRYQIDIDGNASAWSGLFLKLMSGSPVLKVNSELNWRQWYYNDLIPWTHYVPVLADQSDLVEKLQYLRARPAHAKRIGKAGRAFALARTLRSEIPQAVQTVASLVTLNRRVSK